MLNLKLETRTGLMLYTDNFLDRLYARICSMIDTDTFHNYKNSLAIFLQNYQTQYDRDIELKKHKQFICYTIFVILMDAIWTEQIDQQLETATETERSLLDGLFIKLKKTPESFNLLAEIIENTMREYYPQSIPSIDHNKTISYSLGDKVNTDYFHMLVEILNQHSEEEMIADVTSKLTTPIFADFTAKPQTMQVDFKKDKANIPLAQILVSSNIEKNSCTNTEFAFYFAVNYILSFNIMGYKNFSKSVVTFKEADITAKIKVLFSEILTPLYVTLKESIEKLATHQFSIVNSELQNMVLDDRFYLEKHTLKLIKSIGTSDNKKLPFIMQSFEMEKRDIFLFFSSLDSIEKIIQLFNLIALYMDVPDSWKVTFAKLEKSVALQKNKVHRISTIVDNWLLLNAKLLRAASWLNLMTEIKTNCPDETLGELEDFLGKQIAAGLNELAQNSFQPILAITLSIFEIEHSLEETKLKSGRDQENSLRSLYYRVSYEKENINHFQKKLDELIQDSNPSTYISDDQQMPNSSSQQLKSQGELCSRLLKAIPIGQTQHEFDQFLNYYFPNEIKITNDILQQIEICHVQASQANTSCEFLLKEIETLLEHSLADTAANLTIK